PDLAMRKFGELILKGEEVPIFGDGSLLRDFTYVEDIVEGIVRAAYSSGAFEVYNLGNAQPVTVKTMVSVLEAALGKTAHRKFVPAPAGEMLLTHADPTHARDHLGFTAKISFEEGVRRFAEWLQSKH